ncbi:ABC transporter permease [Erythrobacter sp. SCSIO 43205]|uniref:ABC transporter permease n=1 Tax=Erythrobacter sp. SCSIO 43205 TaxID=2779361 RepID=UPI001CA8CF83|nr:ABC transporter permease [Erythrobacter sp. SCSIO 43205]UAB77811.1 ABC transporter permease [Erythrobacter sp. SCSIO 43205]
MSSGALKNTSLKESFAVQGRVLGALLIREVITRYGRHNIGFLWLFVEPMLFTLGVTALWTATKSFHGSDLPIAAFALSGYSSVLLWRNMPGRTIGAIRASSSLLYHRNIKPLDIYLARVLLEAGGASISFLLLSVVFIAIEWIAPPEDILIVIGGWLLLTWFGSALAILIGSLSYLSELVDKFWHPFSYLMFPLSGAAFLVSALPRNFQEIVLILPMVHAVEFIREGYFGSKITSIYDLSYLIVFNLVLSVAALLFLRYISRRVVPG